jgi:transposase
MAMGRRRTERQEALFVEAEELARAEGRTFYTVLNDLFSAHGFDQFCEERVAAEKVFDETIGRPSVPPGVYFRMLLVGYFEGLSSERGIAWRCADSLSLREFLGYELTERTPDHSTLSGLRRKLDVALHREIFEWVLQVAREEGILNRILQFENAAGTEICRPMSARLSEEHPDLGILRVEGLAETHMLRIDWDEATIAQFDDVFVFGYPSLAGLHPGVEVVDAKVSAILRIAGSGRSDDERSVILNARNIPGHSGGPVLSTDGLVVGIVEAENIFTEVGAVTARFTATPAYRLREVELEPEIVVST